MMALRLGLAQMPQVAQLTSSRTVTGHMAMNRLSLVTLGLVWSGGRIVTTGAIFRRESSSASVRVSAERLMVKYRALAWAMARAFPGMSGE